jgi:16S rRNA (cytosine1402-N4)-methyltransferase
MSNYHIPVLLSQCIESLNINPDGIYVDATFGAGGHSRAILKNLSAKGHLYAFDMDDDAVANAPDDARFTLIKSNYRYIKKYLKVYGVTHVDGVLADLGISSHQIDVGSRGFSFRFDAELDMRMNQHGDLDAKKVLNTYSENQLLEIFSQYGEVRNSKTLAREIVTQRKLRPILSSQELNALLEKVSLGNVAKYYAQVYQAIRIEVNQEMQSLRQFLEESIDLIIPNGRMVVMSYHSLEDRLVKNIFKTGNAEGDVIKDDFGSIYRPFNLITKKPIEADANEQRINPRSRSAKLRVAEII